MPQQMIEASLAPYDPVTPALRIDPYPIYNHYRSIDPVHWGMAGLAGYAGAWYLFRYRDAVSVLKDARFGKERQQVTFDANADANADGEAAAPAPQPAVPAAARSFFSTAKLWLVHRDPPDHERVRSAVGEAFTPRAIRAMRPRIEALTHELIDQLEARGQEADFIRDFAYPLPVAVICDMLGVPTEGRALFSGWSKKLQAVDLKTSEETWAEASAAIDEAKAYIRDLIRERRMAPREDLISRLIAHHDDRGRLTEPELVANILFLFVAGAGFETTTGLLGNGMHALLTHPAAWARLQAEPDLIGSTVDEMLRYESPVQMTNRIAREDVEVDGKLIQRGDSVLVVLAAANRDPAVFPEPDRFDIARRNNRHHAFGIGIHYCLGGPLARLEGEVAFALLADRLPAMKQRGPAAWAGHVSLRVLRHLPIAV